MRLLKTAQSIILLSIILISFTILTPTHNFINANPVYSDSSTIGTGSLILTQNSWNLSMPEANVRLDATIIENKSLQVYYNCKYVIFNPDSNLTGSILAPYIQPYYTMTYINLVIIDIITDNYSRQIIQSKNDVYYYSNTNIHPYIDHLQDYDNDDRYFIGIPNVEFPGNSSMTITIWISASIDFVETIEDDLILAYDVGTARTWNGNVTEVVRFYVSGISPYKYSMPCEIMKINKKTTCYSWKWFNEIIRNNTVYTKFLMPEIITSKTNASSILIFFSVLTILSIFRMKKSRKSRNLIFH